MLTKVYISCHELGNHLVLNKRMLNEQTELNEQKVSMSISLLINIKQSKLSLFLSFPEKFLAHLPKNMILLTFSPKWNLYFNKF